MGLHAPTMYPLAYDSLSRIRTDEKTSLDTIMLNKGFALAVRISFEQVGGSASHGVI